MIRLELLKSKCKVQASIIKTSLRIKIKKGAPKNGNSFRN
jgi:hypothetical protein